jgi:hypothetical protein
MCKMLRYVYECAHSVSPNLCVRPCGEGFDFTSGHCRIREDEILGYIEKPEDCSRCRWKAVGRHRRRKPYQTHEHHQAVIQAARQGDYRLRRHSRNVLPVTILTSLTELLLNSVDDRYPVIRILQLVAL